MANFVESLSEQGRQEWLRIYKKFKRKDWEKPTRDERGIKCETKIEDIEEIDKIMREKPSGMVR